jgi:dTDP-3-amino-3,4,6-trideoxy-alpha-D-glucose transaminase
MDKRIPLVDLKAQYRAIQSDIDGAIRRVLESTGFIMGPEVANFEKAFAEFCGAAHCVGVASGTAALELALRALGVGPGDEVITVAHTFIATAEAISAVGARPVFVDVEPDSYNLDPQWLADAITEKTKAIVPVHIYGRPANMTAINGIAAAHGIPVLEDAAQAHGATWGDGRAGTLGDAACFSFFPGKNLGAYGDAGAVVTNRQDVADQVRLLRNHGRKSKYVHEQRGYGERLDALQAAILSAKLPYLEQWTEARRRLARRYSEKLAAFELVLPEAANGANPAWHLYVVRVPSQEERDALVEYLVSQGIEAGVHYPVPLHLQPAYADLGYRRGDFPVTERVAETCVSLPIYPEMTDEQQDVVVAAIGVFLGH